MAQVTLYLDKETDARLREAARREGKSLSGWAREKLAEAAVGEDNAEWKSKLLESFGSITDPSFEAPEDFPIDAIDEIPEL